MQSIDAPADTVCSEWLSVERTYLSSKYFLDSFYSKNQRPILSPHFFCSEHSINRSSLHGKSSPCRGNLSSNVNRKVTHQHFEFIQFNSSWWSTNQTKPKMNKSLEFEFSIVKYAKWTTFRVIWTCVRFDIPEYSNETAFWQCVRCWPFQWVLFSSLYLIGSQKWKKIIKIISILFDILSVTCS